MTDARAAFIKASFWHGSMATCESILEEHPALAGNDIHVAAILGDADAVGRFLADEAESATAKDTVLGCDALTHLCFSCYLREAAERSDAFVRAAMALLDAGASANTGFFEPSHDRKPVWESALYGAAGVAHHAGLTGLLLERGADPNDEEVPYHSPETRNNDALKLLVESGRLNTDSLTTMLLRKADWHDREGVRYLLERGANPNRMTRWCYTALQHAVRRDNALQTIELMLAHGGDPTVPNNQDGRSAIAMAARRGRRDLLERFERHAPAAPLDGADGLAAACAKGNDAAVQSIRGRQPRAVADLVSQGGDRLAEFAGNGNVEGMRRLLGFGIDVNAPYEKGDGYFGVAPASTALHVAAWRAQHEAVRWLVGHGADINARDAKGRTPLMLAVSACSDSYWTHLRSAESVGALLRAGASKNGVKVPSGYADVDALLKD